MRGPASSARGQPVSGASRCQEPFSIFKRIRFLTPPVQRPPPVQRRPVGAVKQNRTSGRMSPGATAGVGKDFYLTGLGGGWIIGGRQGSVPALIGCRAEIG